VDAALNVTQATDRLLQQNRSRADVWQARRAAFCLRDRESRPISLPFPAVLGLRNLGGTLETPFGTIFAIFQVNAVPLQQGCCLVAD